MAHLQIPETAKQFFLNGVDSIAEWEAILVLRERPDLDMDAGALARHLYIGEGETAAILQKLVDRGVVRKCDGTDRYRYEPATAELSAVITTCAELYREYLIPVTRIIHSEPKKRLQAFADAFRIRKD